MRNILLVILVLASAPALATEVVDELAEGKAVAPARMDRPMDTSTRIGLNTVQTAFDNAPPNGNVMTVMYDRNVTYKLRLREMMESLIVLPEGERIKDFVLGDKENFEFTPLPGSREGRVRGIYPGADTNLLVIAESRNVYSFYLRIDSVDSQHLPTFVFYVKAPPFGLSRTTEKNAVGDEGKTEAKAGADKVASVDDGEYLRRLANVDPADYNFEYATKGDETLAPLRIYDDGHWTYFQFGKENLDDVQQLPAVYRVVEGFDVPINTRISGGKLIAEMLNNGWTLRSGGRHLCVRRK